MNVILLKNIFLKKSYCYLCIFIIKLHKEIHFFWTLRTLIIYKTEPHSLCFLLLHSAPAAVANFNGKAKPLFSPLLFSLHSYPHLHPKRTTLLRPTARDRQGDQLAWTAAGEVPALCWVRQAPTSRLQSLVLLVFRSPRWSFRQAPSSLA